MYARCNRRDLADDRWRAKVSPEFDRDHGSILRGLRIAAKLARRCPPFPTESRNSPIIFITVEHFVPLLILNFPNSFAKKNSEKRLKLKAIQFEKSLDANFPKFLFLSNLGITNLRSPVEGENRISMLDLEFNL